MSETLPPQPEAGPPSAPKRPSRGCLIACAVIVLLLAALHSSSLWPPAFIASMYNSHSRWLLGKAFGGYAEDHEGQLPPTLRGLIPQYLSEDDFFIGGYHDERNGGIAAWMYFPPTKPVGLARNTIVLAAPNTTFAFPWRRQRLIRDLGGSFHRIPEADFQRLIREQNPPAPRAP